MRLNAESMSVKELLPGRLLFRLDSLLTDRIPVRVNVLIALTLLVLTGCDGGGDGGGGY